jgi:hypothetical protein
VLVVLVPALALVTAAAAPAQQPPKSYATIRFTETSSEVRQRFSSFRLSPQTVFDSKGFLRLAGSVLLTDELGATDYKQAENLSDITLARKVFDLAADTVVDADLYFYGSAAAVTLNGQALPSPQRLPSTGWSRLAIPASFFKAGANEIVFKGPGQLLVEPGRQPGRSFKSTDGGKTWSREGLTVKRNQQGEYLVRLRQKRPPASGWAISQVFDLWQSARPESGSVAAAPPSDAKIPRPGQVTNCLAGPVFRAGDPPTGKVALWVRTGTTPYPDEKNWTDWRLLVRLDRGQQPPELQPTHRWVQFKFALHGNKAGYLPRLPPTYMARCTFVPDVLPEGGKLEIVARKPAVPPLRGSTPFVYQEPSPRLKYLREHYKLDQVIAPGKTETEQLMLLRYWVRNQWHTAWGSHPAAWMPPWDALIILESKDRPDCLTMCTHYAAVFTQCCQALGWNARHCILDHHCVAEVYIQEHDKWVMMDAGNSAQRADVGLHFERDGVPLSARELHLAHKTGNIKGIQVRFTPARLAAKIAPLCRPAPPAKEKYPPRPDVILLAELKNYPVCQLENYRRYAFPPRNNFLESLYPGELYQGWSEYFYDGYCWVGDSPDNPVTAPEYTWHLDPQRPQDVDWKLNWTSIHLSRTAKPGQVRVDLETFTPNFARFEKETAGGKGKAPPCPASFVWDLQQGDNTLTVWSVNQWDRRGMPAQVTVRWTPVRK